MGPKQASKTEEDKPSGKAHPIRKIVREILAAAFWLHAAYVFCFIKIVPDAYVSSLPRYFYNFALVLFIFYYSFLSDSGWFSVAFDLGYIYFWPFTIMIRLFWISSKQGYSYFRRQLTFPKYVALPSPAKVLTAQKVVTTQAPPDPTVKPKPIETKPKIIYRLSRPLFQFVVLWSILIITVNSKIFIILACLITLVGATRAIWSLWNLLSGTSSWIERAKSAFAKHFAQHISQVRQWNEKTSPEKIIQIVNALKFWEAMFTFVDDNKEFLSRCTIVFAALVSIPFYCYISFLFSCVYFGIAKIQQIDWSWPSAFSTALYMPFSFTDLPHSFLIRFIGGLQAIAVSVMGWSIFMRHLSGKFERIALAAAELRSPLQDEVLKAKITLLERAVSSSNLEAKPS
jgi:hypothetical protein